MQEKFADVLQKLEGEQVRMAYQNVELDANVED